MGKTMFPIAPWDDENMAELNTIIKT